MKFIRHSPPARIVAPLVAGALISCASVFTNPDMKGAAGDPRNAGMAAYPRYSDDEKSSLDLLKKEVIPVQDFLRYQAHLLELAARRADTSAAGIPEPGFSREAAEPKTDKFRYDHRALLRGLRDAGLTLVDLGTPTFDDLLKIMETGAPVFGYGACRYRHIILPAREEDAHYEYDGFVLFTECRRYANKQRIPGDDAPFKIAVMTREGFPLRADPGASVVGKGLQAGAPDPEKECRWILKKIYALLSPTVSPDSFRQTIGAGLTMNVVTETDLTGTEEEDRFVCRRLISVEKEKRDIEMQKEEEQRRKKEEVDIPKPPPGAIR